MASKATRLRPDASTDPRTPDKHHARRRRKVPPRAAIGVLGAATLAAIVGAMAAAVMVSLPATLAPAAAAPPVTLAAGSGCTGSCTTALNAAKTGASVGTVSLPLGGLANAEVLRIQRASSQWQVQVQVTAVSGLALTDGITMTLVGATSPLLTLTATAAYPLVSAAVALSASDAQVELLARGVCLGTCTVTITVLAANGSTAFSYPVTLTLT